MAHPLYFRNVINLTAIIALVGCANGADRYPDLNLREFERVQGTFSGPTAAAAPAAAAPLRVETVTEVAAAARLAADSHAAFLQQADSARPLIASAAGTGIEDNRWPVAQIEIAALESRNGETSSLLADLDSLYADASLSFGEREEIDAAREQVADYHTVERQVIAELIALIASAPAAKGQTGTEGR